MISTNHEPLIIKKRAEEGRYETKSNQTKPNQTKPNQTKPNQTADKARRQLLTSIAAGSGAIVTGKSLPESWRRPLVDSVLLPAHAQTSPSAQVIYAIGDTGPGGGIVFYITNGGLNGLEAAPSDQSTAASWGCLTTLIGANAQGTAIGTGAANTAAILGNACSAAGIAADIASTYAGGGFSDWFLPSQDELNAMYTQLHLISLGSFANDGYWSSSENDDFNAWLQGFSGGFQVAGSKFTSARVRAVRGF